jgi:hypothetical protein
MRRAAISWSVAFALLFAAFGITVAALNGSLYSAGGFVGSYLDALARHDATSALQLPGVVGPQGSASDLLTDDTLGNLTNVRLVRDDSAANGVHTVTYDYTIGGERQSTDYDVRQTGTVLGLFPTWKFASSPLATVAVTVLHDRRFRVNGVDLTSPAKPTTSASYLVFVPGLYTFDHQSTYLTADPISAPISDPGSVTAVQVNVQANTAFVTEVGKELHSFLDSCATQKVLLPTGCPFGKTFDNRVDSTPVWTMATYPHVEIIPGASIGTWLMPTADAAAHLTVKVQSLFDGSITTFDANVPFTVSYGITVGDGDDLHIDATDG